jgi:hypothetical protein
MAVVELEVQAVVVQALVQAEVMRQPIPVLAVVVEAMPQAAVVLDL